VQVRFDRTRGLAIGIFTTATAGIMAMSPVLLSLLINAWGWRTAWVVSAMVVVCIVVPIGWFGLRDLPRGRSPAVSGRSSQAGGFDRSAAMHTASFWMLVAVTGAAGMMSTALNFHQIDLLGEAGLSKTAAAALFIPQVLGSSIAGLTIGYVGDRLGTRYLPAISMGLLLAAQLLAAIAAPGLIAVSYAVLLGAAGGSVRTAVTTLLPKWFGIGHLGSIQGALTLFGVGASAIGPVVLTLAEEATGSYSAALIVLAWVPLGALLFALGPNQGPRHTAPAPA
jgi:MFS family permease